MEFDVSAAEEYLLIHCYSVGYHCAPVTVEVLLCTSTAIEVTKLLQEITPVASQQPGSPAKVIPKLCCCCFTRALSARCSHLAACYCCSHASTAIEVTKLWQNITLVASKPPTSPPKVIPKLCG